MTMTPERRIARRACRLGVLAGRFAQSTAECARRGRYGLYAPDAAQDAAYCARLAQDARSNGWKPTVNP